MDYQPGPHQARAPGLVHSLDPISVLDRAPARTLAEIWAALKVRLFSSKIELAKVRSWHKADLWVRAALGCKAGLPHDRSMTKSGLSCDLEKEVPTTCSPVPLSPHCKKHHSAVWCAREPKCALPVQAAQVLRSAAGAL